MRTRRDKSGRQSLSRPGREGTYGEHESGEHRHGQPGLWLEFSASLLELLLKVEAGHQCRLKTSKNPTYWFQRQYPVYEIKLPTKRARKGRFELGW
jgi:hypothetical protein